MIPPPPRSTLFPYTTLFRSEESNLIEDAGRKLSVSNDTLQFDMGAYEIKTFKLRLQPQLKGLDFISAHIKLKCVIRDGQLAAGVFDEIGLFRSEERRVGKECRSRWWWYHLNKDV